MSNSKDISNYSLFRPKTSQGLKYDYPEIFKQKEFVSLTNKEVLMVWYFACEGSPYNGKEISDKQKIKEILSIVYGERELQSTKRRSYENLEFPDKIQVAIDTMSKFRIGPRLRSKLMIEKIMSNYEKIINVDPIEASIDKDGGHDLSKQKAYVDAGVNIAKNMPVLIAHLEGGFGISEISDEEEDNLSVGGSLIDTYHDSTE